MRKLERRPVSTYNDIITWGTEHLRIYALPTDDLYSFKVLAQVSEEWFVMPIETVRCVRDTWKHARIWHTKPFEVDRDIEVTCLALLNELGEVVGFQNKSILAQEGDELKVDYTFKVEDYNPMSFLRDLLCG